MKTLSLSSAEYNPADAIQLAIQDSMNECLYYSGRHFGVETESEIAAFSQAEQYMTGCLEGGSVTIKYFDSSTWKYDLPPISSDLANDIKSLLSNAPERLQEPLKLMAAAYFRACEAKEASRQGRFRLALWLLGAANGIKDRSLTSIGAKSDVLRGNARKAALARHAENRDTAERIKAWYAENKHRFSSVDAAAEAAIKIEPVAFRTAQKHIAEAAKKLRSARKE